VKSWFNTSPWFNTKSTARKIHGVPAWLHGLSLFWLAAFVFGVAVLVTAATDAERQSRWRSSPRLRRWRSS
jgi:hypothetical protein